MGTTAIMRCAIVGIGLLLVIFSFWFHARKRMSSDLATVWCILGFLVVLVGAVPVLSGWLGAISVWTGIALLCVGTACLIGAFRICLMISRLMTENQELAMMVSLLMPEHQRKEEAGGKEPEDNSEEESGAHEEGTVCH